jgi:hypothetical protein
MRAALRVVDTILEPARPRRHATRRDKICWFSVDLKEEQIGQRGRQRGNKVES